ncbi:hypothetical protein POTOM_028469 [Populus tomentosa]|uniref:Uncharacterized protein n=1 Tax=Populus tomentosa TaxID=118781 RepID=A0A8X7Z933_POPTO|nr:hypothetical protein POTOM_028469 [Populus tomentosa]
MATVLGDRYSSCSNYNFLCSSSDGSCSRGHLPRYYKLNADRLLLLLLTRTGDSLLEGSSDGKCRLLGASVKKGSTISHGYVMD